MEWITSLFADVPVTELRLDLLVKLALATVLGGAIGWEREANGKPAGLRTNILICVGATLLTDLSIGFAELLAESDVAVGVVRADPARIAAQIVSGIGFLGAGTIMQARGSVTGLTTAATLWVVAAIGMSVGAGAFIEATGAGLLVLVVLVPLGWVEDRVERKRVGRIIRVVGVDHSGMVGEIQRALEGKGMLVRVLSVQRDPDAGTRSVLLEVKGETGVFRRVREELLDRDDVLELHRE